MSRDKLLNNDLDFIVAFYTIPSSQHFLLFYWLSKPTATLISFETN
jgi:hypothetical protein